MSDGPDGGLEPMDRFWVSRRTTWQDGRAWRTKAGWPESVGTGSRCWQWEMWHALLLTFAVTSTGDGAPPAPA